MTDAPATRAAITTAIVVVPDNVPSTALASADTLASHLGITGTPQTMFWTKTVLPWQRRHLLEPRTRGKQTLAAGAPVKFLDLAGQRHAAAMTAGIRHHQWTEVVKGTRPATPWHVWLGKHTADPDKHPLDWAVAQYRAQPRILAMATHNAGFGQQFPTADLEALQTGGHAYATYCALRAVCGEALIQPDGTRLTPAGPSMADHIAYLGQAHAQLEALDHNQRILALTG
ncbi:hypothetical protein [Longispora albida]|uniref:hypothetical protein n=1 Tax=Longispora albida TaxID=203523 RepID=UPI00037C11D5|nr:hypothetical protein [Longispora albida]